MGIVFSLKDFPSPEEVKAISAGMNLKEEDVPAYALPVRRSATAAEFARKERPAILRDFTRLMYGEIPPRPDSMEVFVTEESPDAFGGLATRRELTVRCGRGNIVRTMYLLLYLPNERLHKGNIPVFFGLNFKGNHAASPDPDVRYYLPKRYPTLMNSARYADGRANPDERGLAADRFDMENVLKRGYATATVCLWDVYPDHPYGFEESMLRLFYEPEEWESENRRSTMISGWAWGISRAVDALEMQPELDRGRIFIHGLSRLGKAALWAGANDERAALTVSFCSGTLGAKIAHRYYGENYAWINLWNPYWSVPAFMPYVGHDADLPVDQHQLIACIAPRHCYIASASEDRYADPKGEFLSAAAASDWYRLFGSEGLGGDVMPDCGVEMNGDIGYYLRRGPHSCTPENWAALLDYADLHFPDAE